MSKHKKSAIWKAAENGDVESLKKLLDAGADVNAADDTGCTPLHLAAACADIEAVQLLIERGADVNAFVDASCKNGDDVRSIFGNGATPLCCALRVYEGPEDTPEYLERWKCAGRIVARMLLEHGADPNAAQGFCDSPLYEAVSKRDVEDIKLLLEFGADVNLGGGLCEGNTPLHEAVPHGYIGDSADTDPRVDTFPEEEAVCEILLQHGANPDSKNNEGHTPLSECIGLNLYQMTAFFLKHGANPNTADADGSFPLHKAAVLCRTETAALLLDHGADINARDNTGETPLHAAAAAGKTATETLLLERGADINARDNTGETPLHAAVAAGETDFATLLLDHGADVDAADIKGRTPLHLSVFRGTWPVTKFLLHHGANPYAKDEQGRTPLDWEKDDDLRNLMLKHARNGNK